MDAIERLTALKKAYADIILNTAKEAASRIMVSEGKALRFEQELKNTKEHALRMLLRLKQMMDSKVREADNTYLSQQRTIEELKTKLQSAEDTISEADATSLSRQRKVEELEAQLQEAEDIVEDLRAELREVQAEVERMRNKKLQHNSEHVTVTWEQASEDSGFYTSQSTLFPHPVSRLESFTSSELTNSALYQINEMYKDDTPNDCRMGNSDIGIPDVASTSEEGRPNDSHTVVFPPPVPRFESVTVSEIKSSAFSQRNEVYRCHSANDFPMENSYAIKPILPSIILRSKQPEPYRNRRTQRIRAFEEKLIAGELSFPETLNDISYETVGREDEEGERISKTLTQKADNHCSDEKDVLHSESSGVLVQKVKQHCLKRSTAARKKRRHCSSMYCSNRTVKEDGISDISGAEASSVKNDAQTGEDHYNTKLRLSVETMENGILVGCREVAKSDTEFVADDDVLNAKNDEHASMNKLFLMRPESGATESSGLEMPVMNLSNAITDQRVAERVIKYTFQRKRKRGSLGNSDRDVSLEQTISKKKTVEKQSGSSEMERSSLVTESPQDSWHLVQLAHQLISLAEKKRQQ
ncbi:hypothetical protein NMG60_11004361 [Bertholletia excelsa]